MPSRKSLTTILLSLTLASASQASIVTLASGRTGPLIYSSIGNPVEDGLVRVGTFIGAPASDSFEDISLVFNEFDTSSTFGNGRLGLTVVSTEGTPFNSQQIYVWVFNTDSTSTATEHAVFTNFTASPSGADQWIFPTHTGNGTDSVTLDLRELYEDGDASFTPGVQFLASAERIQLTPIPEPSAAILIGCAVLSVAFRRRR